MPSPLKLLLVASSLWYFSEGLLGPLFAVFSEQIGGDVLDITAAWATYLIVSGLAYPVVGKLLNRSRWKFRMIAVGYALNTIFTFAYLLVRDTTDLLFVQIGLGIAEAVSTPSWDAYFASQLSERDDTFAWGIASGHTQFVSGVAIAIGGLIANFVSFQALFVLMGCLNLVATVVQVRLSWWEERAAAGA
ncbi:MAG: MFS transporter [Gemmatimonadetes bacterium]|nr:MFS transporter [Gemmatimonadota bacterium]